jgi:hypothetical protein
MNKIHSVCQFCEHECKHAWTFWDWQMPPEEYCEDFESNCFHNFIQKLGELISELDTECEPNREIIVDWIQRVFKVMDDLYA